MPHIGAEDALEQVAIMCLKRVRLGVAAPILLQNRTMNGTCAMGLTVRSVYFSQVAFDNACSRAAIERLKHICASPRERVVKTASP